MSSRIEQIIEEIEEYIDRDCKFQPLSSTKIIVNKEHLDELLRELRMKTPDEIKRYQKIIANRDAILADAKAKADAMIEDAQVQTTELVSEHEIMQQAYAQANEIVTQATAQAQEIIDNATRDANTIRIGAIQYTDDLLANAESIIGHTLDSYTTKYDGLINSLQECYDTVRSNRAELDIPEEDDGDYDTQDDAGGVSKPVIKPFIVMTDILPHFFSPGSRLVCLNQQQMHRRNRQHNGNISRHISCQFRIFFSDFFQIHTARHHPGHPDLLINPVHQHLFIHGLIFPSEIIVIQINIHIIKILRIRQRLVGKQIIHIKRMFRKFYSGSSQHRRAEYQRMHNQILGRAKSADRIPCTHLFIRKDVSVIHNPAYPFIQMVIHIIAYKQIRDIFFKLISSSAAELSDPEQQLLTGRPIQPVIRIYNFKI